MTRDFAVSVVISTHNRAQYLSDCLESLARQECDARFEVVIIDNASTDNTKSVLETFCRNDPRFTTAHEPRLGLSYGKNAGIRIARAPLILFTDDDIVADPHWIQSYVDLFSRRQESLMICGGVIAPIPHDLGDWPAWLDESALADVGALNHREERRLTPPEYVWGANMGVPKCLFDRFGFWDERVGRKGDERGTFEDTEFQDRIRQAGGSVWFSPGAIVRHRIPRYTITPRKIASTAFARGRNDFWATQIPIWREVARVPKSNALKVLCRLSLSLLEWGFWLIAFRLFKSKRVFERARLSAFASGRILDSLRAGRGLTRLSVSVNRIVYGVRNVLLRLSPDAA